MSSCISGGGRAYRFDIEMIKSPSSTSSITSNSSSILSESSNSPVAISSRKPRTPRKRPNQTYNEAAALLSTAYPKIFSTKHLISNPPSKFTKKNSFFDQSPAELLLPFPLIDNTFSGILLHQTILEKPNSRIELKSLNSSSSSSSSSCCEKVPVENDFLGNCCDGYQDDFDTESMLDEEIEEGIDSIMGNLSVENELVNEANTTTTTTSTTATTTTNSSCYGRQISSCYGYPMGLGFTGCFDFGFGMRRGVRALRQVDEGDWWRFPSVEAPTSKKVSVQKKKKKVAKLEELKDTISPVENSIPQAAKEEDALPEPNSRLLLKLNYDDVLNAWSDRGVPFPDDISGSESSGNDIHVGFSSPAAISKRKKSPT